MGKNWIQIYTKLNAEKTLYKKLCDSGIQAYLPIRIIKKQLFDGVKIIDEPGLKSYIFAKLTDNEMRLVEQLKGFCFFVTYEALHKTICNSQIKYPNITDETIKLIALILMEYPDAIWQESIDVKGKKVEFINGSLKTYQGYLIQNSLATEVVIKLPELNQEFIINVPKTLIKKVT